MAGRSRNKLSANQYRDRENLDPNQIQQMSRDVMSDHPDDCDCPGCCDDDDTGPLSDEGDPDTKLGSMTLHPQTDGSVVMNSEHRLGSHDELMEHTKKLFQSGGGNRG